MTAFSTASPKTWDSKIPSGYKRGYMQQFDPNQMKLYESLFSQLGPESFLSQIAGGDLSQLEQMEAPAWRDLARSQDVLASRFSGMAGGQGQRMLGGQKSSGFRNAMGQLGSDFAQQLQANRLNYRRQALNDLMGLSSALLKQRPYDQFVAEKGPSKFERFMNYGVPIFQSFMDYAGKSAGGASIPAAGG